MDTIKSVLIANRGEIAVRIIKTCNKLNIRSIAVYSDADKESLYVKLAKEAYRIGEAESISSYLNIDAILSVCKKTSVDAIHPGYGFLSENPEFAKRVKEAGILFLGPSPEAIRLMGSKSGAKTLMESHGVPVVPGYNGDVQDPEFLLSKADEIGYPIMIKASSGGGGKAMKMVSDKARFLAQLELAKREAQNFFGNDHVILEKYLQSPRHIEFQVLGDLHGNVIHIFERDCSIQRRHQKIIEESPALIHNELRQQMGEIAVRAAKAVNYTGVGTVEFITVDNSKGSQDFYFLEMNTRLQVEHPVTEAVTGLDLVELQIKVAEGVSIPELHLNHIKQMGHAIEARIYAEDPENGFTPSIGTIREVIYPEGEGIRIDSGIEKGSEVSIYYDPMIAKLIVRDTDRQRCVSRMLNALNRFVIFGIITNISYLKRILSHNDFQRGKFSTNFIDESLTTPIDMDLFMRDLYNVLGMSFLIIHSKKQNKDIWSEIDRNRQVQLRRHYVSDDIRHAVEIFEFKKERYIVSCEDVLYGSDSAKYKIKIVHEKTTKTLLLSGFKFYCDNHIVLDSDFTVHYNRYGQEFFIHYFENTYKLIRHSSREELEAETDNSYSSPMPGKVVKVNVKVGDKVKKGDTLVVVEAMKMQNEIKANSNSIIQEVFADVGKLVSQDEILIKTEKV